MSDEEKQFLKLHFFCFGKFECPKYFGCPLDKDCFNRFFEIVGPKLKGD